MSWTNPASHIFATSEVVTASTMNTYIQANLTFLGIGFGASMQMQTAQAIPTSTETLIHFDTIVNDPNGMCTTGTTAKITIPANAGGVYIVTWSAAINAQWAGTLVGYLSHNGADFAQARAATATTALVSADGAVSMLLAPTDTLQVNIIHNQGTSQNLYVTAPYANFLTCHLISPN